MIFLKAMAAGAALLAAATTASADQIKHGDLIIENTWTRATPPRAKAGGGFITITNNGSKEDRLVAATSPVSPRVELHEMAVNDGVMQMRELADGITIPAGETISLEPGGLHIMFMGIGEGFKQGSQVPVTLSFEHGGDIEVNLSVAKIGAKNMEHGSMDHGDHSGHEDHSGHGHN
ncbi:hypothetical protein JM93_02910 [Roseibium hamelinense]|uniref:Copper(I)-binding protein n=1 Tax=Roseibium hamelinense TaxID=150831 RepID=A0A562SU87_9HYPH|nr:copper chaperone PCu(A)C [Roseibium hamelinense]MTI42699.1 copper chaperone PCu(A)C [Roseibium hamelinense]TWI84578.1 hypothetical protein JM93_02910 [Roseibium hamelinense]